MSTEPKRLYLLEGILDLEIDRWGQLFMEIEDPDDQGSGTVGVYVDTDSARAIVQFLQEFLEGVDGQEE